MVIEIDTYENIEKGVCNALGIEKEYLKSSALNAYRKADENNNPDSWEEFYNWTSDFVKENNQHTVTEIYVCHLARLIEKPEVLMPLPLVLTTDTALSRFLNEHSIFFRLDGHRLILSYKGNEIPPEEICGPEDIPFVTDYPALASRLGYFDKQDFCVNGFAFDAGIEYGSEGYIRELSYGPEILMYLDDFLQTNLRLRYRECSRYYKAFIKAPIEDIIFDGKEEINTAQKKSEYFLEKCIEHLAGYYCTGIGMHNIPIVRFTDDKSVKVGYYIEIPE